MPLKRNRLQEAKEKQITSLLTSLGFKPKRQGTKYWCSSPFSSDSNWSFAVYPTNTFYDWANGFGGDIIDLVKKLYSVDTSSAINIILGQDLPKIEINEVEVEQKNKFKIRHYKAQRADVLITEYAKERGFWNAEHGYWMFEHNDQWVPVPSIMFRHYNEKFELTGVRFRTVESERERLTEKLKKPIPKFNSRGELGWYILESNIKDSFKPPVLYIMESETSATSLYQYFQEQSYPAVILCFGGINNKLKPIPKRYQRLDKYLLIDYDGDEHKFNERVEKIGLKNATPIKLILEKGEDINSLYCRGEMYKISYLLQ